MSGNPVYLDFDSQRAEMRLRIAQPVPETPQTISVAPTQSNMRIDNAVATVIVLLGPVGLIYAWHDYVTNVRKEHSSWRKRFSLMSLGLVSLSVLLWPLMMALVPKADWAANVGVAVQVEFVYSFVRFGLGILLLGFVLCFLGRRRLIIPVVVSCVGIALFWLSTTVP